MELPNMDESLRVSLREQQQRQLCAHHGAHLRAQRELESLTAQRTLSVPGTSLYRRVSVVSSYWSVRHSGVREGVRQSRAQDGASRQSVSKCRSAGKV